MLRFPADAPISKVIKALERLGFHVVREGNHVAMLRENHDGTRSPLTIPNHPRIQGSTLRMILTRAGITRVLSSAPTKGVEEYAAASREGGHRAENFRIGYLVSDGFVLIHCLFLCSLFYTNFLGRVVSLMLAQRALSRSHSRRCHLGPRGPHCLPPPTQGRIIAQAPFSP